ncbi:hypothetical protein L1I79_19580 [Strepomyces sp. STD 3.1]|uniref:hypothetical protein n=1 Tax=Streptomyces sp. NPDC058985 TaxID=3346684 RepID=UPI001F16CAA7|nr:hypothetical protein [Streptomyces sp. STD 3.1]
MEGERHLLHALAKAVAEDASEFTVRPRLPGLKRFAAFAYVAEQSGYRYAGHAPGNAALNNPCFIFRRTSDPRERTATPGSATPDASVELLHSRMVVDASGRYTTRVLSNVLLLPVVLAVFLLFPGYTVDRVLIAAGVWLAFFALYLVGLAVTRHRRARHLARLSAALGE